MQPSSDEARWISKHLQELAQKPVLSELSMGVLREKYFFEHTDLSKSRFDEFKLSKNYKTSSVRIAKHLQDNPNIIIRGEKRGKTYRHKESRPIFTDKMIAKIIPAVLLSLRDEVSWNHLYNPTRHWAKLLHESYETHPDFLDSLEDRAKAAITSRQVIVIDRETMMPNLLDGKKTIQNALEIDIHDTRTYRKKFPSELELWVDDAYSNEWWEKSSSNIQSIMKKEGKAGPGSKRGTWLHAEHRSSYGSMLFFEQLKEQTYPLPSRSKQKSPTAMIKEINTHMTKLDDVILDLFSHHEVLLNKEVNHANIDQYLETVRSEIRNLEYVSDRLQLTNRRFRRHKRHLEEYEKAYLEELQINPETD